MKKIIILFSLFLFSFTFSQEKEILIGAYSEMGINSQLNSEMFYRSDIGKYQSELLNIWKGYSFQMPGNDIEFEKDSIKIRYKFENGKISEKEVFFENFSDFNYYLKKFYENVNPTVSNSENTNSYKFVENDNVIEFSTSFFVLGNKDIYNNDYIFSVRFK